MGGGVLGTVLGLGVVAVVVDMAIRLVALVVVPRNRLPTAAMAWLLAVFFIPVIGVLLFLLIGNPKLPMKRQLKQTEMNEVAADRLVPVAAPEEVAPVDWLEPLITLNRNLSGMPFVDGNAGELSGDYSGSMATMAAEIDAATTYVHVEYYILNVDETTGVFFDALEAAVKRGVTVRVLLDHWASSHCRDYKATLERLTSMGAQWRLMLPVQSAARPVPAHRPPQPPQAGRHRRHGRVRGLAEHDRPHLQQEVEHQAWPDVAGAGVPGRGSGRGLDRLRLRHRLVHGDRRAARARRAAAAPAGSRVPAGDLGCQVVPSGPGFQVENNLQLFLSLLYAARERVIITSPYFVPDDSMLRGLMAATGRGVHVELFVSELGDQAMVWHAQRSYYEALLRTG